VQRLYEQAKQLVPEGKEIADEIFKHSPGTNGNKKMSIKDIQHLIAVLGKHCAELYGDLGKK
jgi:hypothetical protein